jgi:hypothetical protein
MVHAGGLAAGIVTTLTILLASGRATALPVLVAAIAAGSFAFQAVVSGTAWVRCRRAQRAPSQPATIDDPYFYADLTRRLEACAAAARAGHSEQTRAAAAEIGRALDWLSAAQDNR